MSEKTRPAPASRGRGTDTSLGPERSAFPPNLPHIDWKGTVLPGPWPGLCDGLWQTLQPRDSFRFLSAKKPPRLRSRGLPV